MLYKLVCNLKWKKAHSWNWKKISWWLTPSHMVEGLLIGVGTLRASTSWLPLYLWHSLYACLPQYETRARTRHPKMTMHIRKITPLVTCGDNDYKHNGHEWPLITMLWILMAYLHSQQLSSLNRHLAELGKNQWETLQDWCGWLRPRGALPELILHAR